ncbi:hypothetical protein GTO89_00615 [Heliobacterium gestii]|uniref:GerMN domain-containing protein n=1 Tax=Heliomicrobium gestii TaxID=2699 RepID=A0A845L4M4_HELGE|nr:GerMN domain-containing protein [Heliomicrobium gestii]MBM7865269.1 hypothetical protein [Heliomicrobium gestii]MZP41532.1 hypothetical protein [Heliomicrobium gestii]
MDTFMKRLLRSTLPLTLIVLLIVIALSGCSMSQGAPQNATIENATSPAPDGSGKTAAATETTVRIFFPDKDLQRLVKEDHPLSGSAEEKVRQTFEFLKEGPKNTSLMTLIPPQTRLLGVAVKDTQLDVNLSREIRQGNLGSTGEALLIGSLVNSFTSLGYARVQLTVDGQKIESLAGHMEIALPLPFFDELTIRQGPIPPPNNINDIENDAQQGQQQWRLDPLEVTRVDGIALGFEPEKDSFSLVSQSDDSGKSLAKVRVRHGKLDFLVELTQPAGNGHGHIWVIRSVATAPRNS